MHITKTDMQLSSKHELQSNTERQLRLAEMPRGESSFAKLFEQELQALPTQLLTVETPQASNSAAASEKPSPFEAIMQMLFGWAHQQADTTDGEAADGRKLGGRAVQVMELVHTSESESCTFAASGNVCLADGSTRQFDVGYKMERSEESTRVSAGSFHDPLMLDFGAPENKLGSNTVDFDIDADGDTERMRMPGANTGVLFLDRNHNGKADDGSELFGPQSGDGFADLAKLDTDANGWIDEGDDAFIDLKLWQMGIDGGSTVKTLGEAGVGAMAVAHEDTPFTIKEGGEAVGQVRSSSIWLGETGGAGIVRQVDVATTPNETSSA